jgi:hypothetical protein
MVFLLIPLSVLIFSSCTVVSLLIQGKFDVFQVLGKNASALASIELHLMLHICFAYFLEFSMSYFVCNT